MEILDNLPDELKWNVMKYMSHPTAKIINDRIKEYKYDINLYDDDWDFLKHVYINYMLWTYCSSCHRMMEFKKVRDSGGRCPHCDIHRDDFTAAESFTIRMKYRWRDPHRWRDHHFQIYGERPPRE